MHRTERGQLRKLFPEPHLISEEAESLGGQHKTTTTGTSQQANKVSLHLPAKQRNPQSIASEAEQCPPRAAETRNHWCTQTPLTISQRRSKLSSLLQPSHGQTKQGSSSQGPSRLPKSVTDICGGIAVLADVLVGKGTRSLNPLGSTGGAPHINTHK